MAKSGNWFASLSVKLIFAVFVGLKLTSHLSNHGDNRVRMVSSGAASWRESFVLTKRVLSSAYKLIFISTVSILSSMYNVKSRGPRMDP